MRTNIKEAKMKALAGIIAAAALVGPAVASDLGGHWFDGGVVLYGQDSDRGGAKAEVRLNLAPEEPEAAIYLGLGVGYGSWKTKPIPTRKQTDSFNNVILTKQTFLDFGPGISWKKTYHLAIGLTALSYKTDVVRHTPASDYSTDPADPANGSAWGGFGEVGYELPIGHWLACLSVGYRETRGNETTTCTNAAGSQVESKFKPIKGFYGSIGLRMRF